MNRLLKWLRHDHLPPHLQAVVKPIDELAQMLDATLAEGAEKTAGMRMLTPRELFRAQGFPDDYVIKGVWEGLDGDEPHWRAFAKKVQVSCCGNSVCPPLAEAIVAANCGHLVAADRREVLS